MKYPVFFRPGADFFKKSIDIDLHLCYTTIRKAKEDTKMKNPELKAYRQKMDPEEFQMYLHFKKRGGKVPAKKGKGSYNRQKMKKEVA